MEATIVQYGVLGICVIVLWRVVVVLYNSQQEANKRLTKELEEERNYNRKMIADTIEMCRHSVDNNNKLLEDTRKSLDEVSRVLTNYWEQQLKK